MINSETDHLCKIIMPNETVGNNVSFDRYHNDFSV